MHQVVDIISSWPTVAFTFLLAFCLVWWLLSLIVSGLDGDFDSHGHGAVHGSAGHGTHGTHGSHDGHGSHGSHGSHGGHGDNGNVFGRISHFVGIGSVPLSLALTVVSFGGWSASLLLSLAVRDRFVGPAEIAARTAVGVVALVLGLVIGGMFARWSAPVFALTSGPTRADGTGAQVRVRTLYVDRSFGDAEVLTGPRKNAIVRVRAPAGEFRRGDLAVIVDYDPTADTFSLVSADEVLQLDP